MAYRGDDAGDALEAPTADGPLKVSLGPNRIHAAVGPVTVHIAERMVTIVEDLGKKKSRRTSHAIEGLVLARGIPREDLGLWIATREDKRDSRNGAAKAAGREPAKTGVQTLRRVFGVAPVNPLHTGGLRALAQLDALAQRLRVALDDLCTATDLWFARATEIGGGHPLDKVLLADFGDRHAVYARRLFRDRARFICSVRDGGLITVSDGKQLREVTVTSRFGVTVRGDYVRFADRHGTDVAKVSVPWIGPEDREELARRIGQLVHRD